MEFLTILLAGITIVLLICVLIYVCIHTMRVARAFRNLREREQKPDLSFVQRLADEVRQGKYFLEPIYVRGYVALKPNKAVKGDSWSPLLTHGEFKILKQLVSETP